MKVRRLDIEMLTALVNEYGSAADCAAWRAVRAHTEKTMTKKQTKRTGTKARTTRNAGRTAKKAGYSMPRTAKGWAAALEAREGRTPGFIREVWGLMKNVGSRTSTTSGSTGHRAAQVMPREHATH